MQWMKLTEERTKEVRNNMDKIREVLSNATMAHTNMDISINAKDVVNSILGLLKENIEQANAIDVKNNNGFEFEIEMLQKIEKNLENIEDMYRNVISLNKNENNYIQGQQTDKLGNICVVYDGNTYCFIELALKSILTHNAVIFVSEADYMKATNEMVLILIQRILDAYGIDKNLVQILYTSQLEQLLENNISINKVIAIGDKSYQDRIKKLSNINVISKGYRNFDIYIEDDTNLNFISNLLKQNMPIDIYVKNGIEVPFEDYIQVADLDEAIAQINYNTSGYSASTFTNDAENGAEFLREVKSDNVSVNSSPLINEPLNIDIKQLLTTKNMLYPNPLKEQEEQKKIEFPTVREVLKQKKEQEQNKIMQEIKDENEKQNHEIEQLKKQLQESQAVANKYMGIFKNSFLSRVFGKIKKEELEKDTKMLS